MALKEFIQQCLEQNYESLVRSVDGLTHRELSWRPVPRSMSIGFLAWHYGRTLDRWIHTRVLETLQLWEQGWADRFDRPLDPNDTGYGFTSEQLARIPHLAQTSDAVNRQLSCFSSRYMNLLAVFQI